LNLAKYSFDHAPVAMAECAPRIENGNAAAQVLGGGGHVLLGQREASEVDAFPGHPVLHQTLAVEGSRREVVDAALRRLLRHPDAVHVGVGDDAEDVLPPLRVGGERDGEEGGEERQILPLAGVLDHAAAEPLTHQPVQPHRSEGRLGQVAEGVVIPKCSVSIDGAQTGRVLPPSRVSGFATADIKANPHRKPTVARLSWAPVRVPANIIRGAALAVEA
jgi:hypothetical protein